ncbi:hypothetical protein QVD99_000302 [Batrachochytrium dendrobatidis]|nr:hypothetical protein O5D80_006536 [Batrachochytrium dendrobatidis]KAK5672808.1 hypothetical protein QVD99_000302 [Batrachochytrium dendrobatidis]
MKWSLILTLSGLICSTVSAFRIIGNSDLEAITGHTIPVIGTSNSLSISFHGIVRASDALNNGSASISASSAAMVFYIDLLIGTPPVNVNVLIDTGSSTFWIDDSACFDSRQCKTHKYNPIDSTTQKPVVHPIVHREYGDGTSVTCTIISDVVSIAGISIPNQTICAASQVKSIESISLDGILGLGPPNSVDPADLFSNLENSLSERKVSFYYDRTVTPINPQLQIRDAGEVTFGVPNPARYTGNFSWSPIVKTDSHWALTLSSVVIDGKTFSSTPIVALMDTGTTIIILDKGTFNAINSAMGGVSVQGVLYELDCTMVSKMPSIQFNFQGVTLTMTWDQQYFVIENQYCVSVFGYSANLPPNMAIFGAWFLRSFYTSFDYTGRQIGFATPVGVVTAQMQPNTHRSIANANMMVGMMSILIANMIALVAII